jgi:hypothetical protein
LGKDLNLFRQFRDFHKALRFGFSTVRWFNQIDTLLKEFIDDSVYRMERSLQEAAAHRVRLAEPCK